MNDGQGDVLVELKKLGEKVSTLSLSGRCDNYGMFKEFMAMQAEFKQMKKQQDKVQEEQKIAYENVCKELEEQKNEVDKLKVDQKAQNQALEAQKIEYKKVCDELAALKIKQTQDVTAFRGETAEMKRKTQQLKEETADLKEQIAQCRDMDKSIAEYVKRQEILLPKRSDSPNDSCELLKELRAMRSVMKQLKEEMQEEVCNELAARKTKQNQDVTAIRGETAGIIKKQKDQDLQLQPGTSMSIEELIAGKWKLEFSIGHEEYEKHMLTYDSNNGDRAKITYESREFTFDRSLRSYIDNNNVDPSFTRDYYVNKNRRLVYRHKASYTDSYQLINVSIEEQQLIVAAIVFKDSKEVADCSCYYARV